MVSTGVTPHALSTRVVARLFNGFRRSLRFNFNAVISAISSFFVVLSSDFLQWGLMFLPFLSEEGQRLARSLLMLSAGSLHS